MNRNLALDAVRVTEAAALAASRWMGRGDERGADLAAIGAMDQALATLAIDGTVVVGQGEPETGHHLYAGAKAGAGDGPKIDVALHPLEGATITAKGGTNALSVIALSEDGGFLGVPDLYMEKIAVGVGLPDGVVDLDAEPAENLRALAQARRVEVGDLVACILDRPRHEELIRKVREAGARIMLITDGDVSGVVATALSDSGVDIYMGIGGAPQGILAAAALFCVGGQMQGRLVLRSDEERSRAVVSGITDFGRKYNVSDMAHGEVMFAATGVTSGAMLRGVRRTDEGAVTHSLVLRSRHGTMRYVEAHHNFARKKLDVRGP
jgi:fructose-1,6-bisphosphatase II / sedoheptulose-1,7-bisphosphatase